MEHLFMGFVSFITIAIGFWEKPWKRKIPPLITSYAFTCVLMMIWLSAIDGKGNRFISAIILAIFMFMSTAFIHVLVFHLDKKIRLNFWKKQNPDNE